MVFESSVVHFIHYIADNEQPKIWVNTQCSLHVTPVYHNAMTLRNVQRSVPSSRLSVPYTAHYIISTIRGIVSECIGNDFEKQLMSVGALCYPPPLMCSMCLFIYQASPLLLSSPRVSSGSLKCLLKLMAVRTVGLSLQGSPPTTEWCPSLSAEALLGRGAHIETTSSSAGDETQE